MGEVPESSARTLLGSGFLAPFGDSHGCPTSLV